MLEKINLIISEGFYDKTSEIIWLLEEAEKINLKLNIFGLTLTVDRTNQETLDNITSNVC
jgi:hypothetical protein